MKLIEGANDHGVWSIGSRFLLRERNSDPPNIATRNFRFLKENTSIPVPTVIEEWKEDNGRYFTIQKIFPGKSLQEVWPTMTEDEKHRVAKQTAGYIHQLRTLHSGSIQSLGGEGAYSEFLFGRGYGVPHGPISSDDELWTELEKTLSHVPEKVRQRLREKMPSAAPYTFTHGLLSTSSIMIDNGEITGITDWGLGGYFPCWWEATSVRYYAIDIGDMEFKSFLVQYMSGIPDASEFLYDLETLRDPEILPEKRSRPLDGQD